MFRGASILELVARSSKEDKKKKKKKKRSPDIRHRNVESKDSRMKNRRRRLRETRSNSPLEYDPSSSLSFIAKRCETHKRRILLMGSRIQYPCFFFFFYSFYFPLDWNKLILPNEKLAKFKRVREEGHLDQGRG